MKIGRIRLTRTFATGRKISHHRQTAERYDSEAAALEALAGPMPAGCYRAAVDRLSEKNGRQFWETVARKNEQ